jgi:uncharacterized protein (UPF0297 family)
MRTEAESTLFEMASSSADTILQTVMSLSTSGHEKGYSPVSIIMTTLSQQNFLVLIGEMHISIATCSDAALL